MATTVWSGHLAFGLVSVPVQLVTAARRKTISLNMLHDADHSPIRQVLYCKAEDRPLERGEIVKGFEYEKGEYVVIEEKELEKITPPSAKTMDILEFVDAKEVDPMYFDTAYHVLPGEGGEKPYTLLYIAMSDTNFYALAKVSMHRREHIALLRCGHRGLMLHTMFYADELREEQAFRAEPKVVNDKELKLAKSLIENLAAPFEPQKYDDAYRVQLERLIEAKQQGKQVVSAPAVKSIAPVVDIVEALQKSLALKAERSKPASSAARKSPKKVSVTKSSRKAG